MERLPAVPASPPRLVRGDLPPSMVTTPPGPRTRELASRLEHWEAPGINTLMAGQTGTVWSEALGANVLDVDGNRFVDLTSGFGVAALGHRHPRILTAIEEQAGRLLHGLGDVYAHPGRIELAERLAKLTPLREPQVYFAVSGADAVEIALKTALLRTGRAGALAFDPGYHGLTLGALAVTSRESFRRPFQPQLNPRVRRLAFGADPRRIEDCLRKEGVGAVLVEPIVGREGVLLPPPGWLPRLAELCRENGALFIADEIFTGLGRTGHWFAVQDEGLEPDLLCCGKALGGGLPIAAVVGRRSHFACWKTEGEALHTATFVAHPLACAAALACLATLEEEKWIDRAAGLGPEIGRTLRPLLDRREVLDLRGRGMLWGIEVETKELASAWSRRALERGVLVLAGGPRGRVLQIVPPLNIDRAQLFEALDRLAGALEEVASS